MRVWRLARAAYVGGLLAGEGARLFGGRWNSRGLACVYGSCSLELALLESLVQSRIEHLPTDLVSVELELPTTDVTPCRVDLSIDWDRPPPYSRETQASGDEWLRSGRSLALSVPSSVLPQRQNLLINPAHPSIGEVRIVERVPLQWPLRLLHYLESVRRT